jgi:peptide/nickel transport system substrate-binding protein
LSTTPAEIIRLERSDDFFIEGAPCLDEIIIDLVPDPNTVTLGLDNGDYDMASAPNAAARFFLNMRNAPLNDVRVRQALAHAFDEQGWRDVVELGYSAANITGIQNASPFYNADATDYEGKNVDEALALLEEAGVADGFELDVPATADMLPTVEYFRQNMEDIGVTVNIRQVPDFPTWAAEVADGTYDVSYTQVWNWGDPVIGVNRRYDCENRIDPPGVIWSNNSWYCNEEVDTLLDQTGTTFDNDERKDLYYQATELAGQTLAVVGETASPTMSSPPASSRPIPTS